MHSMTYSKLLDSGLQLFKLCFSLVQDCSVVGLHGKVSVHIDQRHVCGESTDQRDNMPRVRGAHRSSSGHPCCVPDVGWAPLC